MLLLTLSSLLSPSPTVLIMLTLSYVVFAGYLIYKHLNLKTYGFIIIGLIIIDLSYTMYSKWGSKSSEINPRSETSESNPRKIDPDLILMGKPMTDKFQTTQVDKNPHYIVKSNHIIPDYPSSPRRKNNKIIDNKPINEVKPSEHQNAESLETRKPSQSLEHNSFCTDDVCYRRTIDMKTPINNNQRITIVDREGCDSEFEVKESKNQIEVVRNEQYEESERPGMGIKIINTVEEIIPQNPLQIEVKDL